MLTNSAIPTLLTIVLIITTTLVFYKYTHLHLYIKISKKINTHQLRTYLEEELIDNIFFIFVTLLIILLVIPAIGIKYHLTIEQLFILKLGSFAGTTYAIQDALWKKHIVNKLFRLEKKSIEQQTKYIQKIKLYKE